MKGTTTVTTTMPTSQTIKHTYTIDTTSPRDTAMGYAKRLLRLHGVRLSQINFRRGPDGAHLVSAPGHPTLRFSHPELS